MWTPSHVLVTVTKARNLLEKGKGGNDAYCIIGLGKEKFLTSVKPKTKNPIWDEQAEFELAEREDLKITVYHKSSIIDEFLGRVVINISELAHENINTHTQWYKLLSKPDKEHKKAEKDRGEIEIRVDFLVKPKLNSRTTGSVFDLSTKTKEKSLSLKNLKDKSLNIKHTIGDKLKTLNRKKSKFAGENQLAEQARRMGGSKLDFLEGEDISSLTSSYSSINGPTLTRINDIKHANSFSRYSQKSAVISETSSINEIENPIVDNIKSPLPPSPLTKSSTPQVLTQQQVSITKDNSQNIIKKTRSPSSSSSSSSSDNESANMDKSNIPIIKQQPVSSPQPPPIQQQSQIITTIIRTQEHHEPQEQQPVIKSAPSESFASIFQASLPETPSLSQKRNAPLPPLPIAPSNTSTATSLTTSNLKHRESTSSRTTMRKLENSFNTNDDDDDNDWASSDEEIVKQIEIETFQRNQIQPLPPFSSPSSLAQTQESLSQNQQSPSNNINNLTNNTNFSHSNNTCLKNSHKFLLENNNVDVANTLVSRPTNTITEQSFDISEAFSSTNRFFSTDLDPFSSSSSSASSKANSPFNFKKNFLNLNMEEINPTSTVPNNLDDSLGESPIPQTTLTTITENNIRSTESSPSESPVIARKNDEIETKDNQDNNNISIFDIEQDKELQSMRLALEQNKYYDESHNNTTLKLDDANDDFKTNNELKIPNIQISLNESNTLDESSEINKEENKSNVENNENETINEKENDFNDTIDTIDESSSNRLDQFNNMLRSGDDIDTYFNQTLNSIIEQEQEESKEIKQNETPQKTDGASSSEIITEIEIDSNTVMRQSERRKVVPTEDLTSDLINSNQVQKPTIINTSFDRGQSARRSNLQFNFSPTTTSTQKLQHTQSINSNKTNSESEDDIKTPDIDMDSVFQEHAQNLNKKSSDSKSNRNEALPDIINQNKGKHDNKSSDKAKKYFESFDGVSFNDITVPDSLRKELEYFDREELLQLIAYQKKYLDYKESRIKDLDNYIDNLVLKVIETQPGLLMQASGGFSLLSRNKK